MEDFANVPPRMDSDKMKDEESKIEIIEEEGEEAEREEAECDAEIDDIAEMRIIQKNL